MTSPPPSWPRWGTRQAQARSLIAQRGHPMPFLLCDAPWRVHLHPLASTPQALVATVTHHLHWEWAGAPWVLQLPASALEQLISHMLGVATLADIPAPLARAAIETSLENVLDALQALGRGRPQWCNPPPAPPPPLPHALHLHLQAQDQRHTCQALLHTDDLGLLQLAGLLSARAPAAPAPCLEIPITLQAAIGCSHLSAQELQHLQPGDWVRLDHSYLSAERVLWLTADGKAGVHVQWPAPSAVPTHAAMPAPPCLIVLASWSHAMPTTTAEPAASETATALASLPIRLTFDLGDVTLPLGELQALQPGQVLSLGHPLSGAVRLRANGAFIGEGDLVEIDGQIGVSVRHLF